MRGSTRDVHPTRSEWDVHPMTTTRAGTAFWYPVLGGGTGASMLRGERGVQPKINV